jgi:flavin-dependent dehydrogenase
MSIGGNDTLAATISLEAAALRPWDAVVAGAGPAGGLVARALASEGAAVLLVDKSAFPREKVCGSCLNGAALAALRLAGLADLAQGLGAVELRSMRLRAGRQEANLALPEGVALSRRALDAALVRAAVASGAAFLPSTEAILEPAAGEFREVRLRSGGQAVKVRTRIAVAADGLAGSFLRQTAGMQPIAAPGAPLGLGAVVDGSDKYYEPGTLFMACTREGYVGVVRLEDGRIDVAAALSPDWMRDAGGAAAAVGEILRRAGFPGLAITAPFRGTLPLTRRRPRVAAQGLFVLGDAAGYLEPFTGEGMSWALQQALLLAPIAAEALCGPTLQHAERWQLQCERFLRQRRRVCQAAIWMRRYFDWGTFVVAVLGRFPGLAAPMLRAINTPCAEIRRRCAR